MVFACLCEYSHMSRDCSVAALTQHLQPLSMAWVFHAMYCTQEFMCRSPLHV